MKWFRKQPLEKGWRRVGFRYELRTQWDSPWGGQGERIRSYGFITYHLIRLIHGVER